MTGASREKFIPKTDELKADLKGHAVRGAGAMIFSQICGTGIQMFSTILLARILSPTDFGLVAMVSAISGFFLMFRRLGLTEAIVQNENIDHRQVSNLFWLNLAFGLGLTLVLSGLAPVIARFYGEPKLAGIAVLTSSGFILGAASTEHLALLKRGMRFQVTAVIEIISGCIAVISAILLALSGWGYWAIVARPLIGTVAMTAGAWYLCRWRPALPMRGANVRGMLNFGFNTLCNYTVSYFSSNLDKVLVGWRFGAQAVGCYDRAYQLFLAPAQQMALPLTSVAVATLSRLQNQPEKYRRYYIKAVGCLCMVGCPMSGLLCLMGTDVIYLLLGPQWTQAGTIFSVFGLGIAMEMLYVTQTWLHLSQGRADRWFRWGILAAAVNISGFSAGLAFGPTGVAGAFVIVLYGLTFPALQYAGKPVGLTAATVFEAVWKYFLAAAAVGGLLAYAFLAQASGAAAFGALNIWLRLSIAALAYAGLYTGALVILFGGLQPVREFFSVVGQMLPAVRRGRPERETAQDHQQMNN